MPHEHNHILRVHRLLLETEEVFLRHGADVNARNISNQNTPLSRAAQSSAAKSFVELLLRYGAEVNLVSKTGNSPLLWAAILDSPEVVKVLLEHGADPDRCGEDGCARDCATGKSKELIDKLKPRPPSGNLPGPWPLRAEASVSMAGAKNRLNVRCPKCGGSIFEGELEWHCEACAFWVSTLDANGKRRTKETVERIVDGLSN